MLIVVLRVLFVSSSKQSERERGSKQSVVRDGSLKVARHPRKTEMVLHNTVSSILFGGQIL